MTLIILRTLCGVVALFAAFRFIDTGDGSAFLLTIGAPLIGMVAR